MKIYVAYFLVNGEPTTFVNTTEADLYSQIWFACVEDDFEAVVGRKPKKTESCEQRVDQYFKTRARDDYREALYVTDEYLDGVIPGFPDLTEGTLYTLLCVINGLEGLGHIATLAQRRLLDHFVPTIRSKLKDFDKVFVAAGWDDNGLRRAGGKTAIVEFTNDSKTKWRLA